MSASAPSGPLVLLCLRVDECVVVLVRMLLISINCCGEFVNDDLIFKQWVR